MTKIKILLLVLVTSIFCSCGVFKKTTKEKSEKTEKQKVEVKTEEKQKVQESSKETVEERKDVEEKETTREETKVTEEVEKTVIRKRKGGTSQSEISRSDLIDGRKVEIIDSLGNKITAQLDTLNKKLIIRVETAPVDETETTKSKKTETGSKQSDRSKQDNSTTNQNREAIRVENNSQTASTRQEQSKSEEELKRKSVPDVWSIFGFIVIAVIFIISVAKGLIYYRRYKNKI